MKLISKLFSLLYRPILREISIINTKIDKLDNKIKAQDTNNQLLFFTTYAKPGESLKEAKIRFFKGLKCENEYIKLKQQGSFIILKKFKEICERNKLEYSLIAGTLLGCKRHEGFIPWDDDIDVTMPYEHYLKLKNVISRNKELRLVELYYLTYATKIIKLCFKDCHPYNLCIDIFPFFRFSCEKEEAIKISNICRDNLHKKISLISNTKQIFCFYDFDNIANKNKIIESYETSIKDYYIKLSNGKKTNGYIFSFCNPDSPTKYFASKDIYPYKIGIFNLIEFKCINNIDGYLKCEYGDYLSLPLDMITHVHDESVFSNINKKDKIISIIKKYS